MGKTTPVGSTLLRASQESSHRVVALAFDSVVPFALSVAGQVFGYPRSDGGDARYSFTTCSLRPGRVSTRRGLGIEVLHGIKALAQAETIVVPGHDDVDTPSPARALMALRSAYAGGARLISICTGAFILAETGLLDGHKATTHWRYASLLAARYPRITVDANVLYVDNGRLLTSAGMAAGIDLCIHVIAKDHGAAVAREVERQLVVAPHRDGEQPQCIDVGVPERLEPAVGKTRDWILRNIAQPLSVEAMAAQANMSTRNFARRFQQETGVSPMRWLLRQRVLLARQLLERSELTVQQIAVRCGWGAAMSLRDQFTRQVGATPKAYRRRFREEHSH